MNEETSKVRKVLLVAPEMEPRGTSEYSVNLAGELQRRGVEVAVFCGPGPMVGVMERCEIPFQIFERMQSRLFRFREAKRFLAAVDEFAPQLIHGQTTRVGAVLRLLARRVSVPIALTVHCPPRRPAAFRRLAARMSGIIATSQDVREELVNASRVDKAKIVVIRNGIDWASLARREVRPILSDTRHVVGSVGPVEKARGHELFLKAAAQLARSAKDLHFVVAGRGEQLPALRRLADELKLDEKLTFATDFASYDEVLGAIDIVVQSSQVDVSGLSILESMGRGRPVIAFNTGTACELVEDGKTGMLVPREDVDSLVRAISELVEDPEAARRKGRAAQQAVAEKFNMRRVAEATLRFYAGVLSP